MKNEDGQISPWSRFLRHNANEIKARPLRKVLGRRLKRSFSDLLETFLDFFVVAMLGELRTAMNSVATPAQ